LSVPGIVLVGAQQVPGAFRLPRWCPMSGAMSVIANVLWQNAHAGEQPMGLAEAVMEHPTLPLLARLPCQKLLVKTAAGCW
jgi:hypothetical protein